MRSNVEEQNVILSMLVRTKIEEDAEIISRPTGPYASQLSLEFMGIQFGIEGIVNESIQRLRDMFLHARIASS